MIDESCVDFMLKCFCYNIEQGFDLSSWRTSLGLGSLLTHEQTRLLLRELGVEEYVGVGCSRGAAPYVRVTPAGWSVPTGNSILGDLQLSIVGTTISDHEVF